MIIWSHIVVPMDTITNNLAVDLDGLVHLVNCRCACAGCRHDISYFDFTCLSYTYLMYAVMRTMRAAIHPPRRARADPVDRKSSKFVS